MIKKLQQQLLGQINDLKQKEQKGADENIPEKTENQSNVDEDPAEKPKSKKKKGKDGRLRS